MAASNDEKITAIRQKVRELLKDADPAHDFLHVSRVTSLAAYIAGKEHADLGIVVPAALLHDIVVLPKNHPLSSKSSDLAAELAKKLLDEVNYPQEKIPPILEAIRSHSFGKNIVPKTKEAQVVQDADRLDAIGAVGIARVFAVSAKLRRPFYNNSDPFPSSHTPDDNTWALDHFYMKLLKLRDMFNTETARQLAEKRHEFMKVFLDQLRSEIINPL